MSFWVGVVDLVSGRSAVGSSLSREVAAAAGKAGGGASASPTALDDDAASELEGAWRSLLRNLGGAVVSL